MTTKFTTAELKRFRAFLEAAIDREEHGPSSDDADALKRQFWGEIRVLLGVNGMSTGLPHLDQLVEDVLQGKANAGLQGPIVILPAAPGVPSTAPPVMTQSASPSVPGPASSNLLSNKSSGKKPAKSSKKPAKRKASTGDTGTKSSAKKPRAAQELTLPSFDYAKLLEVNPNAPRVVRTAIAIVLHKAEEAESRHPSGTLAVLNDPPAFHVPLETTAAQYNRRKLKMRASHARLSFTSLCIETWGFYAFLKRPEKRPEMFWLRGQTGKSPRGGRQPQGPI
ncbi:hypothetical protein F444_20235 [Phytophthora nicotianae P1976]|uniref:Uncharacterized protein n=1 Tax=Phytophthora nicotianae P1976 TaxID=1317066 RepID=A0A080Z589_PHYNI|nr:hypothetical protein F444_20235 [Phytophthora nicotianae P1976]